MPASRSACFMAGLSLQRNAVCTLVPGMPQASRTRAVAMTKLLFEHAYSASLEEQFALEAELQQAASETEDFREGVQAFLEKRVAHFQGK